MEPSIRYAQIGQNSNDARFLPGLHKDTTPQEFDNQCQLHPNYKLENANGSSNALGYAAVKGNLNLIVHIVKVGGKDLLNIGSHEGVTALFYCIYRVACFMSVSEKAHLITPSLLCELGTNINLANTTGWASGIGKIPSGVTALWVAAEKTTRLDLVKMLMCYGGDEKVCGELSENGKAMISQAKSEIHNDMFNEHKELLKVWTDSECAFNDFPKEIKDLIIMEKLRVGKWRQFLFKV